MEGVEEDLKSLLAGEVVAVPEVDLCFLKPNEISSSQEKLAGMKPIVKRSVCYIAMALIFNEEGKMCLIQEAKPSCRGLWYVPAGRVEPGENLIDGVKREVLEEAGLEVTPLNLTCIESYGSMNWFRFNYVAKVTGGQLKTLEQQDEESLQAQWFSVEEIFSGSMNLRHTDFFRSVKIAQQYLAKAEDNRHPLYSIGIQPHYCMVHRPVIVRRSQGSTQVLCNTKNGSHLPCCQMSLYDSSLLQSFFYVLRDVFGFSPSQTRSLNPDMPGLLTIEHCGVPAREHDGICVTSVIILPEQESSKLDNVKNSSYAWQEVKHPDILADFQRRINTEGMLIPMIQ